MNVAVMKTKAELALGDQFEKIAGNLPGDAAVRRDAMAQFAALGLPHRRIEAWKYTDLRGAITDVAEPAGARSASGPSAIDLSALDLDATLGPLSVLDCYRLVIVDGYLAETISSVPALAGVTVEATANTVLNDDVLASEAIVALNTAFATGGVALSIGDGVQVDKPIMIVSLRSAGDIVIATRHSIDIANNAKVQLLDVALSLDVDGGQTNNVTMLNIGDGAHVEHIKVGLETKATHLATWRVVLGAQSNYQGIPADCGDGTCAQSGVRDV